MKRNIPISCKNNSIHFVRQVGQDKVCMYCGVTVKSVLETLSEKEFLIQRMWMNINTKIAWSKKTKIDENYD